MTTQHTVDLYHAALSAVKHVTGFDKKAIESPSRGYDVTFARHLVCGLLSHYAVSTKDIGALLHRDRTTILHAVKSMYDRTDVNPRERDTFNLCRTHMANAIIGSHTLTA